MRDSTNCVPPSGQAVSQMKKCVKVSGVKGLPLLVTFKEFCN